MLAKESAAIKDELMDTYKIENHVLLGIYIDLNESLQSLNKEQLP